MEMAKKELIVLVGNIGSGKSTTARKYIDKGYVAIARDYLRYAIGEGKYIFNRDYESIIWRTERFMLRKFMEVGINIVSDEVGVSRKFRKMYLKYGKEYGYTTKAVVMPRLSMKESVDRRMNDPHGQFNRGLWEEVWTKFDKQYQVPDLQEGFNEVITLTGGIDGN